jgi:hypothetical protein
MAGLRGARRRQRTLAFPGGGLGCLRSCVPQLIALRTPHSLAGAPFRGFQRRGEETSRQVTSAGMNC